MTGMPLRFASDLSDRYRIERELGAGGMATVYLARDVRHNRQVAVKVLHPELSAVLGGERFLKEIELTANLQHPHILPLFDSGEAAGQLFYVMPFVEGETLRARLEREKQLPIPDALRIAREVADALQYAHDRGVIHRDIKPENILLQGGHALVADFGIALAVQQAGGTRMTQTGLSLGTPQYMAPEQAMGEKAVDARADVYALGAVTYEMLAGEPPFTGANQQAIVARVLTERPRPITAVRDTVPPHVEQGVLAALAKLPADRPVSAAALTSALATPATLPTHPPSRVTATSGTSRRPALVVGVLALAAIAVGGLWRFVRAEGATRDLGLPPGAPMPMADWHRNFSVAPDGSFLIYEARVGSRTQLWWRDLHGPEARAIAGTEGAFGTPRISPDGKRVAFAANGELKILTLADGAISSVVRETNPTGGGWLSDRMLFLGSDDGRRLRWIDVGSGDVRDSSVTPCMVPYMLPDGTTLLCGGGAEKFATARILSSPRERRILRRATRDGAPTRAVLRGSDFRLVDDEYLLYVSLDGTLMGARLLNRDSLVVGPSVSLIPMVRRAGFAGAGQYDLTRGGALVYAPGGNADIARLVRLSRDGLTTPLPIGEAPFLRFTPSPDGSRLAAVVEGVEEQELRVYDVARGTHTVLGRGFFMGPAVWSPDGRRLTYRRMDDPDSEALVEQSLETPESVRTLIAQSPPTLLQVAAWPAEDALLVGAGGGTAQSSALLVDPTRTPVRVDTLQLNSLFLGLSPDRRWFVYQRQGVAGVTLQPWPARDRQWDIDADGIEPRFVSPTEIVYMRPNPNDSTRTVTLLRVTLAPGRATPVGERTIILRDPRFSDTPGWSHAHLPRGEHLYAQSTSENTGHYLRVVPGWLREMKRRVDAAGK